MPVVATVAQFFVGLCKVAVGHSRVCVSKGVGRGWGGGRGGGGREGGGG